MKQAKSLLRGPDGQPLLPSATTRPDGSPRFVVPIVPQLVEADLGIRHLVERELNFDGFERPTRDILDAHLETGDLFLDIGAHWGVISLSAVTARAKDVRVIALEPAPFNVSMLMRAISTNRLNESIVVVAAAVGKETSIAELRLDSTMGNALRAEGQRTGKRGLQVPVVTVDGLLQSLGGDPRQRIVMKVDVEGLESDVLLGAVQTIQSGRVALIVWERGQEYRTDENVRLKAQQVSRWLSELGYRHYTLPYHEWGGPLIPATDDWFFSNIFSFAPGVRKRDEYPQSFAERPPYAAVHRMDRTPARTADVARMCLEARTSDGIRWADPAELEKGAEARAAAAATFIGPGSRVLDLGCGSMALSSRLPPGSTYHPADLIARSATCAVVDLNQSQFPEGAYDVVALLEVLEYIHDIGGLVAKCRAASSRLLLSYQPRVSDKLEPRRESGFLSDMTSDELESVLVTHGFRVSARGQLGTAIILSCEVR